MNRKDERASGDDSIIKRATGDRLSVLRGNVCRSSGSIVSSRHLQCGLILSMPDGFCSFLSCLIPPTSLSGNRAWSYLTSPVTTDSEEGAGEGGRRRRRRTLSILRCRGGVFWSVSHGVIYVTDPGVRSADAPALPDLVSEHARRLRALKHVGRNTTWRTAIDLLSSHWFSVVFTDDNQ